VVPEAAELVDRAARTEKLVADERLAATTVAARDFPVKLFLNPPKVKIETKPRPKIANTITVRFY